jgi:hypothetical protein
VVDPEGADPASSVQSPFKIRVPSFDSRPKDPLPRRRDKGATLINRLVSDET